MGVDAEATALVKALGGPGNLLEIDACTTRLRLRITNQEFVNESELKALGAAGILRPTQDTLQVVMGLRADEIADNMRAVVGSISAAKSAKVQERSSDRVGATTIPESAGPELLNALGGAGNIIDVEAVGERLALRLKDVSLANESRVRSAGFRGVADLGEGRIHVLAGGDASLLAAGLSRLL